MLASIFCLEQAGHQALGGGTNDDFIELSFALHAGRDVRGLTESELLTSFPTAHPADHDWSGMDANPDL